MPILSLGRWIFLWIFGCICQSLKITTGFYPVPFCVVYKPPYSHFKPLSFLGHTSVTLLKIIP